MRAGTAYARFVPPPQLASECLYRLYADFHGFVAARKFQDATISQDAGMRITRLPRHLAE